MDQSRLQRYRRAKASSGTQSPIQRLRDALEGPNEEDWDQQIFGRTISDDRSESDVSGSNFPRVTFSVSPAATLLLQLEQTSRRGIVEQHERWFTNVVMFPLRTILYRELEFGSDRVRSLEGKVRELETECKAHVACIEQMYEQQLKGQSAMEEVQRLEEALALERSQRTAALTFAEERRKREVAVVTRTYKSKIELLEQQVQKLERRCSIERSEKVEQALAAVEESLAQPSLRFRDPAEFADWAQSPQSEKKGKHSGSPSLPRKGSTRSSPPATKALAPSPDPRSPSTEKVVSEQTIHVSPVTPNEPAECGKKDVEEKEASVDYSRRTSSIQRSKKKETRSEVPLSSSGMSQQHSPSRTPQPPGSAASGAGSPPGSRSNNNAVDWDYVERTLRPVRGIPVPIVKGWMYMVHLPSTAWVRNYCLLFQGELLVASSEESSFESLFHVGLVRRVKTNVHSTLAHALPKSKSAGGTLFPFLVDYRLASAGNPRSVGFACEDPYDRHAWMDAIRTILQQRSERSGSAKCVSETFQQL